MQVSCSITEWLRLIGISTHHLTQAPAQSSHLEQLIRAVSGQVPLEREATNSWSNPVFGHPQNKKAFLCYTKVELSPFHFYKY